MRTFSRQFDQWHTFPRRPVTLHRHRHWLHLRRYDRPCGNCSSKCQRSNSLHVSYGTGSFDLIGNYDSAGFSIVSDNNGGTSITWNHQAPVIATDQISTVQNADGTTTVLGLHLSDSDQLHLPKPFKLGCYNGSSCIRKQYITFNELGFLTDIMVFLQLARPIIREHAAIDRQGNAYRLGTLWRCRCGEFCFQRGGTGTNIAPAGHIRQGRDFRHHWSGHSHRGRRTGPVCVRANFVRSICAAHDRRLRCRARQNRRPAIWQHSASSMRRNAARKSIHLITLDSQDTLLLKGVAATALHYQRFILHA